jgi:hypothetical protein
VGLCEFVWAYVEVGKVRWEDRLAGSLGCLPHFSAWLDDSMHG